MSYPTYLAHFNPYHDRLGRFSSSKDATPVSISKARAMDAAKTKADVDDIIGTFNSSDRKKLGLHSKKEEYLSIEQGEHVLKRILEKYGNKPVSFFDMLDDGDSINVVLGTRSGDEYRGKGYASRAVQKGMKWYEEHKNELGNKPVVWGVKVDNDASIRIAEKQGFVKDPDSVSKDGEWINYVKKYN